MKTLTKLSILIVLFFGLFHSVTQASIYVPGFNLIINQHTVGDDGNFTFKVAGSYINDSGPNPDLTKTLNIQTVNGIGTNTDFYEYFGLYQTNRFYLTQDSKMGWNTPSIECHSDNPLVTISPTENGVFIIAQDLSSIVCDFSNIKKNSGNSSIMFLPGIEGSRLYESDKNNNSLRIWEPNGNDTQVKTLSMDNNGIPKYENDIYTKDVIDNAYIPTKKGDIYKSFLEQLSSMKKENIINDYSIIPYDWRLSIDDILNNGNDYENNGHIYYSGIFSKTTSPYIIKELRRLAANSSTGKVTIITHSTGGLITESLTDKLGPESSKLIDKIIFVAVPQVGTPSTVGALLHGFNQALPKDWLSIIGISNSTVRDIGQNMPEPYNLLPSSNYFTYVDDPVITFDNSFLLSPWREKYGSTIHSAETMHRFLTDISRTTLPTETDINSPLILNNLLLNKSEVFHNTNDRWTPPNGIQLIEIAGWGNKTLRTIEYYQGFKDDCGFPRITYICPRIPILQFRPKTVLDGDGTVLEPSALWTSESDNVKRYWLDLKSYAKSNIHRDHANIFEVTQLRTFLQNIITNNMNVLPEFISTSAPQNTDTTTQLHFILHSPLSLDLYDDQGNHTGFLPDGTLEENIPESTYKTFGEVKFISVPASSNIHLKMKGYEKGSFTLDIEKAQGDTTINTTTFAAVPTLSTTIATVDVSKDIVISPLSVDEDGNGTADITLNPKVGEVVIPDFTPPEAKIYIDPSSKDLKVEGVDDSGITTVTKDSNNYIITDKSNNKTKLFFQKTYSGKYLTYAKLTSIQYGDSPIINLPSSSFLYIWNPLVNPQTILSQTIAVDKTYVIEAVYDNKKNQTTVLLKNKGTQIQKQTFAGFHTPKLNTTQGVIGYEL